MALIFATTPCGICGAPLGDNRDGLCAYSAFIANSRDPSYMFSDGAFHAHCLAEHPQAARSERIWRDVRRCMSPGQRTCVVCGQQVLLPDDAFFIGFLTDDPAIPAHEFNFVWAHQGHLRSWDRFREFERALRAFERSDAYDGPAFSLP